MVAQLDRVAFLADAWQRSLRRGKKEDLLVSSNPHMFNSYLVTASDPSKEPYQVNVHYDEHFTTCDCTGTNTHGYCKHQALVREQIGWLTEA